jgi:hypothetical protein
MTVYKTGSIQWHTLHEASPSESKTWRLLHSGLEDTHFGIYSSDSELMDISNTSGRDLKCTVLLSSEKLIFYIQIHLPQFRVLK